MINPCYFRDGNFGDIAKAGSLHDFLVGLHKQFGPIASFWYGPMYTVSIADAKLFQEHSHVFDRPGMYTVSRVNHAGFFLPSLL